MDTKPCAIIEVLMTAHLKWLDTIPNLFPRDIDYAFKKILNYQIQVYVHGNNTLLDALWLHHQ